MTNCPKCHSKDSLVPDRLDDNRSYQWVPAVKCFYCGYYLYPLVTEYELRTNKVLHKYPKTWRYSNEPHVPKETRETKEPQTGESKIA